VAERTIAAGVARALIDVATSRGADRATLLQHACIVDADLDDREGRLPFDRYVALMRAGQALSGDPALALHFGESVPLAELSIGMSAAGFAGDFLERLVLVNRYAPLLVEAPGPQDGPRFAIVPEGDRLWLVDARLDPNDFPELTESTFARVVSMARATRGARFVLHAAHFTHPEPSYRSEYDRIFRAPLVFAAARNALLVDATWGAPAAPFGSRPVAELLRARSEELLGKLERSKSFRGRVEARLLRVLPSREVGIERVARALGVSRQTLFRRLKAEGVTFEKVLDDLRHRLAIAYLHEPGASIGEVTYRLGFSEPAAFSRAFKRWTGSSPGAVLRRERGNVEGGPPEVTPVVR